MPLAADITVTARNGGAPSTTVLVSTWSDTGLLSMEKLGAGWTTEDRLEARGYVTLNKHKDATVSWQITEAGIKAHQEAVGK